MRILGVDPGSARTGYGCIETTGSRHRVILCGSYAPPATAAFPDKLLALHARLVEMLAKCRPDAVAVEDVFYAKNARSALRLGHVRGVLLLAASQARLPIAEYTPTQVKRALVGYGRAEKQQVQQMVVMLLGLETAPSPLDVSDALAVAVCHAHLQQGPVAALAAASAASSRSWRRSHVRSLR